MFTKEFIKISQILDHNGMHRQADDLLRIAQSNEPSPSLAGLMRIKPQGQSPVNAAPIPPGSSVQSKGKAATKPAAKTPKQPSKPAVPTAKPALMIDPTKQNERYTYYSTRIALVDNKEKAENLKAQIDDQYKNNLLDYATYKKLIDELKTPATNLGLNLTPMAPINPTAFPVNTNEQTMMGRTNDMNGKVNSIQLATPLEGLTAAGEKALPNREDRNLPGLVNEWNDYLKTDSFKQSLEARIKELGGLEKAKTTNPDLVALYEKANSKPGLEVGDFGNKGGASEVYGVEAKPLTTITGTPTTPAAGTATTTTPVAPTGPIPNR